VFYTNIPFFCFSTKLFVNESTDILIVDTESGKNMFTESLNGNLKSETFYRRRSHVTRVKRQTWLYWSGFFSFFRLNRLPIKDIDTADSRNWTMPVPGRRGIHWRSFFNARNEIVPLHRDRITSRIAGDFVQDNPWKGYRRRRTGPPAPWSVSFLSHLGFSSVDWPADIIGTSGRCFLTSSDSWF